MTPTMLPIMAARLTKKLALTTAHLRHSSVHKSKCVITHSTFRKKGDSNAAMRTLQMAHPEFCKKHVLPCNCEHPAAVKEMMPLLQNADEAI